MHAHNSCVLQIFLSLPSVTITYILRLEQCLASAAVLDEVTRFSSVASSSTYTSNLLTILITDPAQHTHNMQV